MAGGQGSPAERINLLNSEGHAPKLGASATAQTPEGSTLSWNPATKAFDLVSGGGGGGGAPANASYVVLGASAGLTAERVLAAGAGLTLADGGGGGSATLSVYVAGQTTGDLLVRSGQQWGRLAGLTQGWMLTSQGAGQLPSYQRPRFPSPWVWTSQRMVTVRDGVVVLCTVPFNPLDFPGFTTIALQSVINTAGNDWYVHVRLYNLTNKEYIDDSTCSTNNRFPTLVSTEALAVGDEPTFIRNGLRLYEIHASIVYQDPGNVTPDDFAIVGFAGLRIE
jgi:hypothetical protein